MEAFLREYLRVELRMPPSTRDRFFPSGPGHATPTPADTAGRFRSLLLEGEEEDDEVEKKTPKRKKALTAHDLALGRDERDDDDQDEVRALLRGDLPDQEEEKKPPPLRTNPVVLIHRSQIERVAWVVQEWDWVSSVFKTDKFSNVLKVCDAVTVFEWELATQTNPYLMVHHLCSKLSRVRVPRAIVQACTRLREDLANSLERAAGANAAALAYLLQKRDLDTSFSVTSVRQAVREAGFELVVEEIVDHDPSYGRLQEHPLYEPLLHRATMAAVARGEESNHRWIKDRMFLNAKLSAAAASPLEEEEQKKPGRISYARRDEFRRLCNNVTFEDDEFSLREFAAAEALLARNLYMLRLRYCKNKAEFCERHNRKGREAKRQRLEEGERRKKR